MSMGNDLLKYAGKWKGQMPEPDNTLSLYSTTALVAELEQREGVECVNVESDGTFLLQVRDAALSALSKAGLISPGIAIQSGPARIIVVRGGE